MSMKKIFFALFVLTLNQLHCQIAINMDGSNPNLSAMLDVNAPNKGILIPRISLSSNVDTSTVPNPASSLVVYNTNANMTNGNGVGFYYWDGSKWVYITAAANGPGVSGQVLASQGPNNPPQWSTLSTNGGGVTGCANCISSISNASTNVMIWKSCADYCKNLTESGFSDWRMPTVEECIFYRSSKSISANGSWVDEVWTTNIKNSNFGTVDLNQWITFRENDGKLNTANYNSGVTYCRCVR